MRLNLEIPESKMAALRKLQKRLGIDTMKELINYSISTVEWTADEVENGNEIAAINEDKETFRVLVTPPLRHLAEQAQLAKQARKEELVAV